MSGLLEPGAVYRALEEVNEGAEPADVYQRLMSEAPDPEELIEDHHLEAIEADHDLAQCRSKAIRRSFSHGFTCQSFGDARIMTDCPCTCHKEETP